MNCHLDRIITEERGPDWSGKIVMSNLMSATPYSPKKPRNPSTGYCRVHVLAGMLAMLTCFGRAAEPLKIGMVAPVTGPLVELGSYQIQGAKLAVEEINKTGGVLGRPIELVIEDDQTTNPGVVLAFSKLAGDKDIPGFIGPILSTQVHAIAPDIQRTGRPVMIGATDPQLTHMGNPWLFRCRPNDNAKSLEPQKIREAILSVKGYAGAEGTYNFDQNGDGLRGYNIVKNDNGKIVFIKHIDFSE